MDAAWSRSSVLGQSLIEVLAGLVETKELTDDEAIAVLSRFDESFEAALERAPPAHYSNLKEPRCDLRGHIETRNRCEDFVHLVLDDCRLIESGRETRIGRTRVVLADVNSRPRRRKKRPFCEHCLSSSCPSLTGGACPSLAPIYFDEPSSALPADFMVAPWSIGTQ